MKRDKTGKFTQAWNGEFKSNVQPSERLLTRTIAALQQQNEQLQAQVAELQARLEGLQATDRPQAELSLQATEERLSLVLQATNDAIYDRNLKTDTVWWNPAYDQLFGERPLDCNSSQWWIARLHPEDRDRVIASFAAALSRGDARWSEEYRYQRADGRYAHVIDRAYILRDDNGVPERYLGAISDVTQIKQVEAELKQLEEWLQLALASARMVAWDVDLQTNQVVCSPNAREIWGIQSGSTADFFSIVHPEDRERMVQSLEQVRVGKDQYYQEFRIICPDQTIRWLNSQGRVYFDSQGQAIRLVGASVDISDRKQAEQSFQHLAESIPQIVWVAQANGFTEYYNQRWFQYTGLTLEASQTANGSFRHPEDHERFIQAWMKAVTHKQTLQAEQRLRRVDGVYRWHLTRAYPLLDQNGEIVKWFGTCTDIDDWKRMEQTQRFLAQASQTFVAAGLDLPTMLDTVTRLASELTRDVCVLNLVAEDGRSLNPVSCYHPDPDVRAFVADLLEKQPRHIYEGIGGRVMQTGEPFLMSVSSQQEFGALIKPEYHLYLQRFQVRSTLLVPLKVQGQPIGLLSLTRHAPADPHTQEDLQLFQDLADRAAMAIARAKLYEAEQRARVQAEAANRMKDEFLAVLSHELRTPMNPILGWSRLLQRGNLDANRTAIALETIERNAKLQVQLIEDLLDISRILQGKLTLNRCSINLASIIHAALDAVRLEAEAKGLQIQTHLATEAGLVWGDATRLQQVLWNLLSNAVKFTPEQGQIEIQLAAVAGQVQIQIKDTGKGISAEFLPFVFETFRQADSSTTRIFGGLGLGLAIARHIIELHGGTIQAASLGEGQGATFTVQLPGVAPRPLLPLESNG